MDTRRRPILETTYLDPRPYTNTKFHFDSSFLVKSGVGLKFISRHQGLVLSNLTDL